MVSKFFVFDPFDYGAVDDLFSKQNLIGPSRVVASFVGRVADTEFASAYSPTLGDQFPLFVAGVRDSD